MKSDFKNLLSPIQAYEDKEHGVVLKLLDYEHRDYIEDVLLECFNLETPVVTDENITGEYLLYFGKNTTLAQVNKVTRIINEHHNINKKLYGTV